MINLTISEAEFNELYPDLEGLYDHLDMPPPFGISKEEFETKYLSSKLWRLNNIYTIVNKYGKEVTFRMNKAQHIVYARSRQHPRVVILKSRQQGISTFWLVSYEDDALFAKNFVIGLMAQGLDEASTLLERAKFIWDKLSDDIKCFLDIKLIADNSKKFAFSNGSNIFIRVSFRSATLQRMHISEFGKIANANPKRALETKTGTLQALAVGNTGVIESTAEGRNMFKTIWDNSVLALESGQMTEKDFYPVFLSWLDDPDCVQPVDQAVDAKAAKYFKELEKETGRTLTQEQRNFWVVQYRELGGDVHQEYPGTPEEAFLASRDGTYYSRLFNIHVVRKGRVVPGLYDENLPTDIYFDLGVDDYMVMMYVQWYRGDYRIVKEYWNNGYSIGHYLRLAKDSGIQIRDIVLPHDAKQRVVATQGESKAKNTWDITREWISEEKLRWHVRVLAKAGVADGIEAVRRIIPNMYVDASCTYTIDCFNNYSKEWDEKLQVWKKTPLHDEYSHGADTVRQIAMGVRESAGSNDSSMAIPSRSKRVDGFAL